jgi:outer membrane protein TolC
VRRAEAAAGVTRLDLDSARRLKAPQVGLSVDAGLAGTDLTQVAPPGSDGSGSDLGDRLRRDLGASLSLDMSLPLNRPGLGSTVAAREADLKAAELRLTRARSVARLGALDLLSRWNDGARRLAAAQSAATLAESNLLRVRSLYFAGSVSLLELLDSRRAWLDATDREAAARHDLHLVYIESEIAR